MSLASDFENKQSLIIIGTAGVDIFEPVKTMLLVTDEQENDYTGIFSVVIFVAIKQK